MAPDVAVWNTFFALIQLFIGVGLLFRRTVRPALAVSFVWVLGVWVIGEGLGMLFTGTATALTGAPGSVLMYGLIGLMAWPRPPRHYAVDWSDRPVGRGLVGRRPGHRRRVTPLAVWAGYWSLAAVLFLLPANRTTTSVQSAIVGHGRRQPGWYAHFLTSLGNLFSTTGTQTAWILAAVSLVIGLGPLVARRPGWFLAAGALSRFFMWITGQGLVGGVFTGSGTDPNTGPLVILLAAGHGADRDRLEGGLAFARRRGPAAEPRGGRPRRRRPRRGARAQRHLSRRRPRSRRARHGGHGHGREQRRVGVDRSQSATASTCVPHQTASRSRGST